MTFGSEMRRHRKSSNLSLRALSSRLSYAFGYLGQVEREERNPPLHLSRILDDYFKTDGLFQRLAIQNEVADEAPCAGPAPTNCEHSQGGDDVKRQEFLRSALGTGLSILLPARSSLSSGGSQHDMIATLAGPTAHYRRMELAISSRQLTGAVDAHLKLARHISGSLSASEGFAALAETAGLSAWLAVDRGDHASARNRYVEAIECSRKADNPLLAAYMLASFGFFVVENGSPTQGIKIISQAENEVRHSGRIPDQARAWLASFRALGYARISDKAQAESALHEAEELVVRGRGEPCWPWVFAFDEAKASRYRLGAYAHLDNLVGAQEAYAAAQGALTAPKSRAAAMMDLAEVLERSGETAEACEFARKVLEIGVDLDSERLTSRVLLLRGRVTAENDAAELDEQLSQLYSRKPENG